MSTTRTETLNMKVTKEAKDFLKLRAKSLGMTITSYLIYASRLEANNDQTIISTDKNEVN